MLVTRKSGPGWPPTRRRPLILAVPIRKFYLSSKRLRAGKEPASGDDSEGREPSGKILPADRDSVSFGVRPQLAESLVCCSVVSESNFNLNAKLEIATERTQGLQHAA